jgi:hypothetical protein
VTDRPRDLFYGLLGRGSRLFVKLFVIFVVVGYGLHLVGQ